MSVQTVNLLLGNGELFFKRKSDTSGKYRPVGNVKSASFAYEIETVEQKPGNRLTVVRRDKVAERATLTCSIIDFKIQQLIAAMGQSISTTQITVTSTLRLFEELVFRSITTTKTLAKSAVSTTSVVVQSADRGTVFVKGTDFTVPSVSKIKPILAGFANRMNFVAYDTKDNSATVMLVGDKVTLQEVDLKFTHKLSNGKYITIEIPIATITGGLTLPFSDNEYTAHDVTFAALGDTTATTGRSLFRIIRQA